MSSRNDRHLPAKKSAQRNEALITATYRVLIVDDQKIIRQGLQVLLEASGDIQIVGDTNGDGAIVMALDRRPDVIIMDLRLPDVATGMRTLSQLRDMLPETRVIILTVHEDQPDLIYQAIRHGAMGYVLKSNSDIDEVATAIQKVALGQVFISSSALATLVRSIQDEREPPSPSAVEAVGRLTPREYDVLNLVAQGLTNRQIADRLVISESTARSHLHNILDKLQMSNRVQAAAYALRLRLPASR